MGCPQRRLGSEKVTMWTNPHQSVSHHSEPGNKPAYESTAVDAFTLTSQCTAKALRWHTTHGIFIWLSTRQGKIRPTASDVGCGDSIDSLDAVLDTNPIHCGLGESGVPSLRQ